MKFYKFIYLNTLYMIINNEAYVFAKDLGFYKTSLLSPEEIISDKYNFRPIPNKIVALTYPEIFNARFLEI